MDSDTRLAELAKLDQQIGMLDSLDGRLDGYGWGTHATADLAGIRHMLLRQADRVIEEIAVSMGAAPRSERDRAP